MRTNRKEMIAEIARQAGCSKRLVRKKLFSRSAELKRRHRDIKFNDVFLNSTTNWLDENVLKQKWREGDRNVSPYQTPNTFDVSFFPSGCVVLFAVKHIYEDGFQDIRTVGTRLYSF